MDHTVLVLPSSFVSAHTLLSSGEEMEKHETSSLVIQFIALILAVGVVFVLGSYPVLLLTGIVFLLLAVKKTVSRETKPFTWIMFGIAIAAIAVLFLIHPYYYQEPLLECLTRCYESLLWHTQNLEFLRNWLVA